MKREDYVDGYSAEDYFDDHSAFHEDSDKCEGFTLKDYQKEIKRWAAILDTIFG